MKVPLVIKMRLKSFLLLGGIELNLNWDQKFIMEKFDVVNGVEENQSSSWQWRKGFLFEDRKDEIGLCIDVGFFSQSKNGSNLHIAIQLKRSSYLFSEFLPVSFNHISFLIIDLEGLLVIEVINPIDVFLNGFKYFFHVHCKTVKLEFIFRFYLPDLHFTCLLFIVWVCFNEV